MRVASGPWTLSKARGHRESTDSDTHPPAPARSIFRHLAITLFRVQEVPLWKVVIINSYLFTESRPLLYSPEVLKNPEDAAIKCSLPPPPRTAISVPPLSLLRDAFALQEGIVFIGFHLAQVLLPLYGNW